MIPIHMSQIAIRLDNIPNTPLELLRLGESPIYLAVPEDFAYYCVFRAGDDVFYPGDGPSAGRNRGNDLDDKNAACAGLESDFT